jgi:hypothetical protein
MNYGYPLLTAKRAKIVASADSAGKVGEDDDQPGIKETPGTSMRSALRRHDTLMAAVAQFTILLPLKAIQYLDSKGRTPSLALEGRKRGGGFIADDSTRDIADSRQLGFV